MSQPTDEPMIRFAGEWIPAHDAWKKMETATVVVDHIDRFNTDFPHLSSPRTRDVVPLVRRRLKDIELYLPRKIEYADIAPDAIRMLATTSPEDVVDALAEQFDTPLSLDQLIQIAGEKAYLGALQRGRRIRCQPHLGGTDQPAVERVATSRARRRPMVGEEGPAPAGRRHLEDHSSGSSCSDTELMQ